jgi:uncharacterized protein (DUF1697 family)
MDRYVALLRGINVGGNNLIRMTDLKACFEAHGFRSVATYIQSGNVLFETDGAGDVALAQRVEEMLSEAFSYPASVVLRTRDEMRGVARGAPEGFGAEPELYRYDVIYLKEPLTADVAVESVLTREGVDAVYPGEGVLYFTRLASQASMSRLSRIGSSPIYPSITIRNWNTTRKLIEMLG